MTELARPTQAEIARAIALEEAYNATHPLTPDKVREAVGRLYGDWMAEGGKEKFEDVLVYAAHVAKTQSPTSEDRGEVRALWSFMSQPEGAPKAIRHQFLAQACGESRGYQVLEDTPVGLQLTSYELWDPGVQKALTRQLRLDEAVVQQSPFDIWDAASASYAGAATGEMAVFAADIGADSILGKTEMPRVVGPEGVGREAVRFAIDFPHHQHLPTDMYDLLADEGVRCQLRVEDYLEKSTTPRGFADKLAAVDVPEHLREARDAAVERLRTADAYSELVDPRAEVTEPELAERDPHVPELTDLEPEEPQDPTAGDPQPNDPELEDPEFGEPEEPQDPAPGAPDLDESELEEPEFAEPEMPEGPAFGERDLDQPEHENPEFAEPEPPQPQPKVVVRGQSFLPGSRLPQTLTGPPRPSPAMTSTHGVMNPVVETAPKAPEMDR
ncbi:hypothetical protein [Streptomyces katrae]|uniref:hypothetical protein n=1 Tax=Streptomyces katrae TaxID=68223 RepID=UPI0009A4F2D9|nr:hypothetical protein [Streptomyces katrae]